MSSAQHPTPGLDHIQQQLSVARDEHDAAAHAGGGMQMMSAEISMPGVATASIAHLPMVDGVDVAQLLRDIGEASAHESSVELFRLCLGAQRVLQQMLSDRMAA